MDVAPPFTIQAAVAQEGPLKELAGEELPLSSA